MKDPQKKPQNKAAAGKKNAAPAAKGGKAGHNAPANAQKASANRNQTSAKEPVTRPDGYRPYTFKERLLPSVLLALLAPLSVCFVAPFEIFGNNIAEFKFVLADFWGLCVLIALGAALVLGAVLLVTRGRVFDVVFGLIFGLSLMFFVQGNYLSLGQTALEGDGVGDGGGLTMGAIVINSIIWIAVTLACVAVMVFIKRHKDTVRLVSTMALAIMLFMTVVTFAAVSLTTEVYEPYKDMTLNQNETESGDDSGSAGGEGDGDKQMLTVKNLDTLATEGNIVVFVVDRFDHTYYTEAKKNYPQVFSELEGFTHFNDYISLYPRTFPGVAHLMTGSETDFSLSREDYLQVAFEQSPVLRAIKAEGYDINLYTDGGYYGYTDAKYMADYTSNTSDAMSYEIVNKSLLSMDMLRLALYRSLPSAFRFVVGDIRTTTFDRYVMYDTEEYDVYSSDMREVYTTLMEDELTLRPTAKGYSVIHINGCHLPNAYDANFGSVSEDEKWNVQVAMTQSFKIISRYLSEMKRMGVYDDATILILGDHASIGSDTKDVYYPHLTTLLVKPAGASSGAIKESHAPITYTDVFATILDAAGSPVSDDYGRTVFEIAEDEERTRRYLFQRMGGPDHELIVYEIKGSGLDFDNWRIVDRRNLGKSIYQ